MKKIAALLAVAAVLLLAASCDTTVTSQPRNHQYRLNEAISIYDDRSGEPRAVLTVTGAVVLLDEAFSMQPEEGETQGSAVTYRQIVQVYYVFNKDEGSSKRITRANFTVWDQGGVIASRLPAADNTPAYQEIPRAGESSFVVALQNPGGYIDVNFRYSVWQARPTARIRIDVPSAGTPPVATTQPMLTPPVIFLPDESLAVPQESQAGTRTLTQAYASDAGAQEQENRRSGSAVLGIGIGVAGICVLAAAILIVNAIKKKGDLI